MSESTEAYAVSDDMIRQAVGFLKLEPLVNIDPNDHKALKDHVEKVAVIFELTKMRLDSHVPLTKLSHAFNLWGLDLSFEPWVMNILHQPSMTPLERVEEIVRGQTFLQSGASAIDYPLYCIIKYQNRMPDEIYEPADIHCAADIALKIAQSHDIKDLHNTYFIVEMILTLGENFMEVSSCDFMQQVMKDNALTPDQKIDQCYAWLTDNLDGRLQ